MFHLETQDWLFILAGCLAPVLCMSLLKILYSGKSHVAIPVRKPMIAWLPKYVFEVDLAADDRELGLAERLTTMGFRESREDRRLVFSRGSALGEFSIKTAKLLLIVRLPLKSPLELRIEYATVFGTAFDTGDLWKFSTELRERLQSAKTV